MTEAQRARLYRAFGRAMFKRGFRVCLLNKAAGWTGATYPLTAAGVFAEQPAPENRGTLAVEGRRVLLNVSSITGTDVDGVARSFEPNAARRLELTVDAANLTDTVAKLVVVATGQ
jgi:hypothetical protein